LTEEEIQHKLPLRRLFLNPKAVQNRYAFADKHRTEEVSFWYDWWFDDELSVNRTDGDYTTWSFYRLIS
jgi:hypothetical protein